MRMVCILVLLFSQSVFSFEVSSVATPEGTKIPSYFFELSDGMVHCSIVASYSDSSISCVAPSDKLSLIRQRKAEEGTQNTSFMLGAHSFDLKLRVSRSVIGGNLCYTLNHSDKRSLDCI
ncbi:MAG: hypothetical protein AB8E15_11440 [Bdellovibrionales bacterium]